MSETTVLVAERMPRRELARAADADITPMQMIALAVQQGADIDKLSKLMDLRDRFEATEARKAFDAAIAEAKAEIKPIAKRQEVDFTSQKGRTHYRYEGFGDIAEEVDPILAKHGLSYRHRSSQEGAKLTITCVLSHRDGHSEETSLSANNDESGNKNSIQAIGSTATFLQRYTLKLALGLSTTKDDDARSAGEKQAQSNKPEGYDSWAADMEAKADDGTTALQVAWQKSSAAFRVYATSGGDWWARTKARAKTADVQAAEAAQ